MNSEMIQQWLNAKEALNAAQAEERALRIKITSEILGDKIEGSVTTTIDDIKCTAVGVISYKVDEAELDIIKDDLSEEELACIRYKPELNLKNYRKLKDSILAKAIVAKPGMAQFKVV